MSEAIDQVTVVLKRARQLLQRGWCQGYLARDAGGVHRYFDDERAVEFCALGAMHRADHDLRQEARGWRIAVYQALLRLDAVLEADGVAEWGCRVVRWNNAPERTQEEVLAAFDRAAGGK